MLQNPLYLVQPTGFQILTIPSKTKPPIELNKPIVSMPLSVLKLELGLRLRLLIPMRSTIARESLTLSSSCFFKLFNIFS